MDYTGDLVEGRFKVRLNRFLALVEVNGREAGVHVANSGRMRELLVPGYRVLLKPRPGPHRKTGFDLALVDLGNTLASADAFAFAPISIVPCTSPALAFAGPSIIDLIAFAFAGPCLI